MYTIMQTLLTMPPILGYLASCTRHTSNWSYGDDVKFAEANKQSVNNCKMNAHIIHYMITAYIISTQSNRTTAMKELHTELHFYRDGIHMH